MRSWIAIPILALFMVLMISLTQGQEKSPLPGELYDMGIDLFYRGKYEEAIATFTKLNQSFPASNLVPYSHHMIGQCDLKTGLYEEAIQQFEFYLKTFP
jgi:TolA-binding protein